MFAIAPATVVNLEPLFNVTAFPMVFEALAFVTVASVPIIVVPLPDIEPLIAPPVNVNVDALFVTAPARLPALDVTSPLMVMFPPVIADVKPPPVKSTVPELVISPLILFANDVSNAPPLFVTAPVNIPLF